MAASKISKTFVVILGLCLLWLQCWPATSHALPPNPVNAVIGDISFYNRFGSMPTSQSNETLRLQTHLAYVETFLRKHTPSSVPTALYPQREKMLNLLNQYHKRGVFPTQSAFEGRRPHFIDEQGNLCAVGYLVAQTSGREMAETINQRYAYAYLPEMQMPELERWAAGSGLTTQELAMIQPTYEGDYADTTTVTAYNLSLWVLWGLQIGMFIANSEFSSRFDAQVYSEMEENNKAITIGSGLLLVLLSFAGAVITGLGYQNRMISFVAAPVSLVPLSANLVVLYVLDEQLKASKKATVSVGSFQTPNQQMSWGIQAQMSF